MRVSFARKREIVRQRQESAELTANGYRCHETDWQIIRGSDYDKVIVDAKISRCGKYVWTKVGLPSEDSNVPA